MASKFARLIGDVGGAASRGFAKGYSAENDILREIEAQKRAFSALWPIEEERARRTYSLKQELEAPGREKYRQSLGATGLLPSSDLPSDLEPDMLDKIMQYSDVVRRQQEEREGASARAAIGPYLSEVLGETQFPGAAGERRQQMDIPYTIPEEARKEDIYQLLGVAKTREAVQGRAAKVPAFGGRSAVWQAGLAMSGWKPGEVPTPEQITYANEFVLRHGEEGAYRKTQAGIEGKRDAPPVPSPKDLADLRELEFTVKDAQGVLSKYKKEYAGLMAGGVRGRFGALTGILTGEEAEFRADAKSFAGNIRRQLLGAAQTIPELRANAEAIPDPDKVSARSFVAAVEEITEDAEKKIALWRQQYGRPIKETVEGPPKKRFASPDAVGAAVRSGKITPEQAKAILQTDFGFE